jgi:hypothetical protein
VLVADDMGTVVEGRKIPRKGKGSGDRCTSRQSGEATEFDTENHPTGKLLKTQDKILWLGGRDSNPDNGVQSAVSYR